MLRLRGPAGTDLSNLGDGVWTGRDGASVGSDGTVFGSDDVMTGFF